MVIVQTFTTMMLYTRMNDFYYLIFRNQIKSKKNSNLVVFSKIVIANTRTAPDWPERFLNRPPIFILFIRVEMGRPIIWGVM